jgi:hypothetical protein
MRRPATFFPIFLLTIGALVLAPSGGARADAPGEGPIEIDKCQTISHSGSYKLVNNISELTTNGIPGGNCLVITAGFVTIDLAGFSIGFDRGIGVFSQDSGITVRNGSISASRGTAVLLNGDGSIVEGLYINLTQASGISAKGIVRGNTITTFLPGDTGISASGSITDNYVNGAATFPPAVGTRLITGISAEGTVRGNTVLNSERGLIVSPGSTVIGNTVTGNSVTGIEANCPANLTDNTAVNNGTNLVLSGSGCNNTNNVAP